MFSFLKRKAKGSDIGLGFFESIQKARLEGYPKATEILPTDTEIGRNAVWDEWLYLDIFTVDFAVFLAFGTAPENGLILEPFWFELQNWLLDAKADALPERFSFFKGEAKTIPAESSEPSFNRLTRRMKSYRDCILHPHQLGENYSIGSTFSSFCGEMDISIIMGVSAGFSVKKVKLCEAMRDYRIIA